MLAQDEAAAAKVYREVLNPGKSELKRELKDTIRGQERDIPAFIAKQRVPIEAVNGRLDTTNAIKVMQSRADEVDDALTEQLKQDTKRWFSVSSLEKRAIEDIGKKNLTAFEKNKLVEDIKRITDAERVSRGLSEADDVLLTGSEANNFKRGLYHLSNYDQTVGKSTGDEIKNMARLTKEAIEDNYKTQDVKGINKMLGDYVESIRMLQNAHGRVVKGGVLGKKLNQVIGAFVGAQVGGAPGALAGVEAASRLTNYQLDPLRRTSSAISKLEKAGSETGLERLSKPKVPKAPGSMGEVSKMLAVAPVGVGGGAVDFEKVKDFFMEDSVDENGQTTRVVDPVKLIGVGLLAAGAAYGLKKSVRMKATAQEPGAVKLKGWSFQVPEKVLTNRSVKGDAKLKDIIQSSKVVRPFSIKGEPNGAAWQFFDGKRVHYLLTEVDDRGKELVKTWLKFDRESLSSKGKDESKLLKTLRAESEHSLRNKK
jgi:hypothetical protein